MAAAAEDAPLRVGINCAGTGTAVRTIGKDGTPHIRSEWDRVLGINLLGTFLCMTHEASARSPAASRSADGLRGVIVNTASVAAFDGQIGQLAYSASKGGVVAMTLPAARDLVGGRHPGVHHRSGSHGHAAARACCPPRPRRRSATASCTRSGSASRTSSRKMAMAIVDNDYLNGEIIRLDGAIRMQPK